MYDIDIISVAREHRSEALYEGHARKKLNTRTSGASTTPSGNCGRGGASGASGGTG